MSIGNDICVEGLMVIDLALELHRRAKDPLGFRIDIGALSGIMEKKTETTRVIGII